MDGTSLHYPDCLKSLCTGCLPPVPQPQQPALDLSVFRRPAPREMPIAARPQDWAPQARAILHARGAWH